jgi:hypothetical protein
MPAFMAHHNKDLTIHNTLRATHKADPAQALTCRMPDARRSAPARAHVAPRRVTVPTAARSRRTASRGGQHRRALTSHRVV